MVISMVMRAGILAAAVAAGTASAQSLTPVQTDTGPPPAEDRDSVGAVVLENSMVRAQRAQRDAFRATGYSPTRVSSVGRGAARAMRAARTKEDLEQQREDDQVRLHEMGAGSLAPR
jgi:hypothetical protein